MLLLNSRGFAYRLLVAVFIYAAVSTSVITACTGPFNGSRSENGKNGETGVQYPLSVSSNGRFIQDSAGTAVLINGDAAWSLAARLDTADIDRYLDDRSDKGFNAIYVNAIERFFSDSPPTNAAGEPPFDATVEVDGIEYPAFDAPNEKYWEHIDATLQAAHERDIVVFLFPAYLGWQHSYQGWADVIAANGVDRMGAYGEFLGRRYRDQPNIVWMMGGDWGPESGGRDLTDEINALAEAIGENSPGHLMSGHSRRGRSALDDYNEPWLDVNTAYGDNVTTPERIYDEYKQEPPMPFFYIEGYYENENDITPAELRAQAYWSITGGAFGQFFGNHPIWFFGNAGDYGGSVILYTGSDEGQSWRDALDSPGSREMRHVGALLRSRPFERLIPDYDEDQVMTDGKGQLDQLEESYSGSAVASDQSFFVAYIPEKRPVTIDVSRVGDGDVVAWWFNPRNGDATAIDLEGLSAPEEPTSATADELIFEPADVGDWVLVIDAVSAGFSAPGNAVW